MLLRLRRARLSAPGAAALLAAVGMLLSVACGYEVQVQQTPTPPAPLGVRQIPGQPAPADTAAAQPVQVAAVADQSARPAGAAPANDAAPAAAAPAAAAASAPAASAPAPAAPQGRTAFQPAPNPSSAPADSATTARASAPAATTSPAQGSAATSWSPTQASPAPNGRAMQSYTPAPSATRTATPAPSPTASPSASPTPTAKPSPTPSVPRGGPPVTVQLTEGMNDFLYVGATQTVDRAMAGIAGLFDVVYFQADGTNYAYKPGDLAPTLPTGTAVRIGIKKGKTARLTMTP
jgi:hypothetical protein